MFKEATTTPLNGSFSIPIQRSLDRPYLSPDAAVAMGSADGGVEVSLFAVRGAPISQSFTVIENAEGERLISTGAIEVDSALIEIGMLRLSLKTALELGAILLGQARKAGISLEDVEARLSQVEELKKPS